MPDRIKADQVKEVKGDVDPEVIYLRDLVYKVRDSKKQDVVNAAFGELSSYLEPKIRKIVGKFRIPGYSFDDILQEAFYALQFKAIKDYNEARGKDPGKPAAFDRFALLCIRRHLATTLKTSKQNRHSALNLSKSLDADRSTDNDELSLINIVCSTKGDVVTGIQQREYFNLLINKLWKKLSDFEKQVFLLYANQHTYEEIARVINTGEDKRYRVNIKGVDNALSRIKNKAKLISERVHASEDRRPKDEEKTLRKTVKAVKALSKRRK